MGGNTDIEIDLEGLNNLKANNKDNPFVGYLNINSFRYKIIELKEIILKSNFEILAVKQNLTTFLITCSKLMATTPPPHLEGTEAVTVGD